jgi:hypothetical protein
MFSESNPSTAAPSTTRPAGARRMRRGLVALGVAVALPCAFGAAQAAANIAQEGPAAAYDASVASAEDGSPAEGEGAGQAKHAPMRNAPCLLDDVWYPEGTWMSVGGYPIFCSDGRWIVVIDGTSGTAR